MDHAEFRKRGRQMVDYIADYMESLHLRRVTPDIEPGKCQSTAVTVVAAVHVSVRLSDLQHCR